MKINIQKVGNIRNIGGKEEIGKTMDIGDQLGLIGKIGNQRNLKVKGIYEKQGQAGAELGQAQVKLVVIVEINAIPTQFKSKLKFELHLSKIRS